MYFAKICGFRVYPPKVSGEFNPEEQDLPQQTLEQMVHVFSKLKEIVLW